jgi:hypothetical protein
MHGHFSYFALGLQHRRVYPAGQVSVMDARDLTSTSHERKVFTGSKISTMNVARQRTSGIIPLPMQGR